MKLRITTTIITLSLLFGLVLWSAQRTTHAITVPLAPPTGGCATASFAAAQNYGVGSSPRFVVTGDFNRDGKPDVATANRDTDNVSVLINNGDGTFAAAQNFAVGADPESVTTGDFNADGKLDLAAANSTSDNVSVLLGNGDGTFAAAQNFGTGNDPQAITASDFDADGKLDLATANLASDNASVLLGNGDGTFAAPQTFGAGDGPESVTAGDFDTDGKLDIATANRHGDNVSVLLGNGDGTFAAAQSFAVGDSPNSVTAGDFNADGKLDLAAANTNNNNVSVLLGNGDGTFAAAQNFAVGTFPNSVTAGDFNADGKLDLATANGFSSISVLLGNSDGSFAAAQNFGAGAFSFSVATADFNADGKLDLATANRGGNNASILLNNCTANTTPVALCQNVTVAAGASCTANASINNGSYDPDSGDTITLTQSPAGPYPLGATTVMLTVTDASGASSSCQATVTVVDQTAPTISCPANVVVYLPPNSMDTGMVVNYPTPTVSDNCTASPTLTFSKASGSSFLVGTTTVNVTATDAAGNQASCSFTVTVRYNFSGFFQPVDNLPMVNSVNAGQSIPVKFSLSGNKGLNIFAAGYPQSQQVACSGGTPDNIEETVTAGGSSLSYDATTDQYSYVWKTDKAWKGTCRQLVVTLNDGTTHVANFQFK